MSRIYIGITGIFVAFVVIIVRLFFWQIVSGDSLRIQANAQYYIEFILPATRGAILASDGNPLVMNIPAYLAYAQPKDIPDKPKFSAQISELLGLDESVVLSNISQADRVWVPLAHKVEASVADSVKNLNISGLGFERDSKRYYPESSMAAHLLGFVASDQNGADKGYFGLEGNYDRQLRGIDGRIQIEKDVRGAPIIIGNEKRIGAENGRTLSLWLDRSIQRIVEKRLAEGIQKYGAKQGTVVIMDPKTGGILAMASFPGYDPGQFSEFDKQLYTNPIVGEAYEPGSTFKVLVVAAALSEGVIESSTVSDETGPTQIGQYLIRTWDNKYRGRQTVADIIQHSSNVGMVFVGNKLGKDRLISYIKGFGFGSPTGIDLEDEQSPDLREDNEWKEIDLATATFGQGIAVTPIQMVRAVSAIANDGWLYKPHLVKTVIDAKNKVIPIPPEREKRIISKKAADIITEIMINAVDNGEAKWAKPAGYRIAGKTGTAQIPVAGHYDEKKTIASFVGFAPADDPSFVMLVTLREPSSSQWGSETAAPLFFTIAQDIFRYQGVAPQ